MPVKPGKYIHFKGKEYEVIGNAAHSETLEEMVVYRALYGDGGLWVRPAAIWNEIVEHNGRQVKRFTHEDEIAQKTTETAKPITGIHNSSPPNEKIDLFLSLFAGRDDVNDGSRRAADRRLLCQLKFAIITLCFEQDGNALWTVLK